MALELGTALVEGGLMIVSGAGSALVASWKLGGKYRAIEDRLAKAFEDSTRYEKECKDRQERQEKSMKERLDKQENEFNEFVKEEHEQWLSINRTLGNIEGTMTGGVRPRMPSRPDR